MGLHRLAALSMGVPNVEQTKSYYVEFGLQPEDDGWFSTTDGGRQLQVSYAPTRRLRSLSLEADSHDDCAAIASRMARLGLLAHLETDRVSAVDAGSGVEVIVTAAPRRTQAPTEPLPVNGPGRSVRVGARSAALLREERVRPRKLGHAVLGTTDFDVSYAFFTTGVGLKPSDFIKDFGAFLRCSTDHHNLLIQRAPVRFLHHTSWQVDDVDDIGRAATAMLEGHPERHVWGLGRHYAGSNFFWYLKDPAGNFSEYYSDMDCIVDDALWTPEELTGARGLYAWGPPPPPSFIKPEDLAEHMIGAHG